MSGNAAKVAIVGVGHSRIFRRSEVPLGVLAIEAIRLAVEDAGLSVNDIDGLSTTPYQPFAGAADTDGLNIVTPEFIMQALGLDVAWSERQLRPVGASLINAAHAVASGQCRYAVCFRGMDNPQGTRYGHISSNIASGSDQFTAPYGVFPPAMYSRYAIEHFHRYGSSREQLADFVVRNRQQAMKWENGYWYQSNATPLTHGEYFAARLVSTPLGLYDCDIPVQAAAAFVLASSERSRGLKQTPAYIQGMSNPFSRPKRSIICLDEYIDDGAQVGRHLWQMAGIGLDDVDVINLYDGFSIHTPLWAEALGLCSRGEGFDYINSPDRPLNTSGGSLGAGRVHGIAHIMESVLQVQGRSGSRQIPGAQVALSATNPCDNGSAILFSSIAG